jgi:hypothetical protein
MKNFKIILIFVITLSAATTAMAQTAYVTSANGVNVRSGKGTTHAIVTTIPANKPVKVISKDGDWWLVEFEGQKGYVSSQFLSEKRTGRSTSERNTGQRTTASHTANRNSAQKWGIGLHFGDPSGITFKKYLQNGNALELNVGRTHFWDRRGWYDSRFDNWYMKKNYGYKEFQYLGYHTYTPGSIQLHYLFHTILSDDGGLQLYYGVGGQLRSQRYTFDYRYKLDGNPHWYYATGDRVRDMDIGLDGALGLEYRFKNSPISVFTGITMFMELSDDPFLFWLQGGIGGRFNF